MNREDIIKALVDEYSSPHGARNYDWDPDKPDGPDNEYHLRRSDEERRHDIPSIRFTSSDGYVSTRFADFEEIADAIMKRVEAQ